MSSNSPSEQSQVQPVFAWRVQQLQTPQTFSEKLGGTPSKSIPASTTSTRAERASSSKPQRAASSKSAVTDGSRKRRKLNKEEEEISRRTATAIALSLETDQILALYPDADTPFEDEIDVVNRLLPYHVFQNPGQDLNSLRGLKGKTKMTEEDVLKEEIRDTKFAIECYRRYRALEERMRHTRIQAGKRPTPSGQAIALERLVLEADHAITSEMDQELSSARSELDKLLRAQRAAKMNANRQASATQPPSSSSFYASSNPTFTTTPATSFSQYYNSYTYPYGQSYVPGSYTSGNYSVPAASSTNVSATQTTQPSTSAPPITSPTNSQATPTPVSTRVCIPLTMPVTSLPALQALGILPVPKAALPPPDEPQPAAVLLGSTNNGSMLSLEINAARLQPPQMSGLAVLLTTLVQMSSATPNNQATGQSVFRVGSSAQNSTVDANTSAIDPSLSSGGPVGTQKEQSSSAASPDVSSK